MILGTGRPRKTTDIHFRLSTVIITIFLEQIEPER